MEFVSEVLREVWKVYLCCKILPHKLRIYDAGHNLLKLYNILVQLPFTTSKTELGNQYKKSCRRNCQTTEA